MKIIGIKIALFEVTDANRLFELTLLDGMQRDRWIHSHSSSSTGHAQIMRVTTDEGIEGVCTVTQRTLGDVDQSLLAQLRHLTIGENPLYREKLYQKLHTGTRWVYQEPGWAAAFDNCLWDIAGKAWGVPVYRLLGGPTRDRIRLYPSATSHKIGPGGPRKFAATPQMGKGYVDHVAEFRRRLGPDGAIMLDAHCAMPPAFLIQLANAIEPYDVLWIEEPAVPGNIEALGQEGDRVRQQTGRDAYELNVQQYCAAGLNFGYFYDDSPIIAHEPEPPPAYTMSTLSLIHIYEPTRRYAITNADIC